MACQHHERDESCADCRLDVERYEKPGKPVDKQRGLELARAERAKLAGKT